MRLDWYSVDYARLPRGVLVVDTSHQAAPLWSVLMISVFEAVASALPPFSWPEVVFLGGQVTHPLANVLRGLGSTLALPPGPVHDLDREFGRQPMIGPWMRRNDGDRPRPTVIVTTQAMPDLDDWATPALRKSTAIYRTGGERISSPDWTEWDTNHPLEQLARYLTDAPRTICFQSGNAVAVEWNEPSWSWSLSGLRGPAGREGVRVCFATDDDALPDAEVVRESGAVVSLTLTPIPPPPTQWLTLTDAEERVLALWRQGTGYWCSHCQSNHTPGRAVCIGETRSLFPTLTTTGAHLFEFSSSRQFRALACGIALLGDHQFVHLTSDEGAILYNFEDRVWSVRSEPSPPLVETTFGTTVLVLGQATNNRAHETPTM